MPVSPSAPIESTDRSIDLSHHAGKKRYRRDKPWDHAGIDHWKAEEWKPEHMPGPLLEESSFATLFPKVRLSVAAARACVDRAS